MASYAREIRVGIGALESFSKCMNCAPPMNQNAYNNQLDKYAQASIIAAENSIKIDRCLRFKAKAGWQSRCHGLCRRNVAKAWA